MAVAFLNNTLMWGQVLYNESFPLHPEQWPETSVQVCSSMSASFARMRSQNSTEGVSFTVVKRGVSVEHKGMIDVDCVSFDVGAVEVSAGDNKYISGRTAEVPPFPPAPPSCSTYISQDKCPERCFWHLSGCLAAPPIWCTTNDESGESDGPMCVSLSVDSSLGNVTFTYATSEDAQLLIAPPQQFSERGWYSIHDGQVREPAPHLRPWQHCAHYVGTAPMCADSDFEFVACLTLSGAYDLQGASTDNIAFSGKWVNRPFVAEYFIEPNCTGLRGGSRGAVGPIRSLAGLAASVNSQASTSVV